MPLIQPVKPVNYGELLLQGLQAGQRFQGIQAQQEQTEYLKDKRKAEAEERFNKERTIVGANLVDKPPEFAINYLDRRIAYLEENDRDPSNTVKLRAMYASNDPQQIQQANYYMGQAKQEGQSLGYIPKPKQSAIVQEAERLYPGDIRKQNDYIKRYRFKPQTSINLGGEGVEQKELGKLRAGRFEKVLEAGDQAQNNITSLDILDSAEVQTGRLEPFKQSIAAWGTALGIDTNRLANVPAGQAFTAESSKVVLQAMQAQKGPQTESDMKQIRTTVSNLRNDPRANAFINNAARATSLKAIEKSNFYNGYLDEHDTFKGVESAWNDYGGNAPLVSKYKNGVTGLPIFFHEFERDAIATSEAGNENQPGFTPTREQIVRNWKERNSDAVIKKLRAGQNSSRGR